MAILDLYGNSEHRRNLAHFASLATLAESDGEIDENEKRMLDRFAYKLNITEAEFKMVMKRENKFPIDPPVDLESRLERLYDLFKIIFSDHLIDDDEMALIKRYATGLGFSNASASKIIEKSVAIFSGRLDFEDYLYLIKH